MLHNCMNNTIEIDCRTLGSYIIYILIVLVVRFFYQQARKKLP